MKIDIERERGRGRPKMIRLDTIENNKRAIGVRVCVCIGDVENCDKWKLRTRVVDLKWLGERQRRSILCLLIV
jgi:hypothetical protein